MSLKDLPTNPLFDTSTDEVARRFLIPALQRSVRYDRGVGFFSSAWLRMVSRGLIGLAEGGGLARIVASPKLSPEDWAALRQGTDAQQDPVLHGALSRSMEELAKDMEGDTLAALAWMVADALLEFRIAIPTGDLDGDFHDKFGQFHDEEGNSIAFHGSPNDSERAFRNYESISCFYSWVDEREARRVASEIARFRRVWENRDVNLRVYELPEAIRRNLVQFTERSDRPYKKPPERRSHPTLDKWRHQREALAAFLQETHGVLAMATGAGKTRTALAILDELHTRGLISTAIVTMSGTDLLDQWRRELSHSPYPVYSAYANHREQLQFLANPAQSLLLISRQMLPGVLGRLPEHVPQNAIIICDEVHGLGAEGLVRQLRGLVKPFKYRLGLSATPERAYDEEGNLFIEEEIGPIIYEFGLEDAIRRGILCELDYVPLPYALSREDRIAIRDAIRAHHARLRAGEPSSTEDLYRQIAGVRKATITKLAPFEAFLRVRPEVLRRCLIFVENKEYGVRVQELILKVSGQFHTYFGEDARDHLQSFSTGDIDCLITCHRISEGIDIRSVSNVVLFASSRAKLETVQRLGRCLRTDERLPDKRATVVDFIEALGDDQEPDPDSADEERRAWFEQLTQVRRERQGVT